MQNLLFMVLVPMEPEPEPKLVKKRNRNHNCSKVGTGTVQNSYGSTTLHRLKGSESCGLSGANRADHAEPERRGAAGPPADAPGQPAHCGGRGRTGQDRQRGGRPPSCK
jgi:hypothetical protein